VTECLPQLGAPVTQEGAEVDGRAHQQARCATRRWPECVRHCREGDAQDHPEISGPGAVPALRLRGDRQHSACGRTSEESG
jgi:hypothetical protein